MDSRIGYDDDFYAWTQEQARLLREAARERLDTPIDWEHVAGEIEDMGRSDAKALGSALKRVIEHLLKLEHSPAPDPRLGWRESVVNHRIAAWDEIDASPSLRRKIDLARAHRDARRLAVLGLARDGMSEDAVPQDCPYTLEQVLDHDWWPTNRHGLE
ncbi:DUF29 domain-containing protein [Azospirillum argentinense]